MIEGGMDALLESADNSFTVVQPGSTVATALVAGEAKPKHVALLSVCGESWKLEALPLTSVRPFVMREVVLEDHQHEVDMHTEEQLMLFLREQVDSMLVEVKEPTMFRHKTCRPPIATHVSKRQSELHQVSATHPPPSGSSGSHDHFPLVRLRVDYSGFTTCNPQRFGQYFVDRVANPGEILCFHRRTRQRQQGSRRSAAASGEGLEDLLEPPEVENPSTLIQDLVGDFLSGGKDQMRLLHTETLHEAIFTEFVGKESKGAILNSVRASLEESQVKSALHPSPTHPEHTLNTHTLNTHTLNTHTLNTHTLNHTP